MGKTSACVVPYVTLISTLYTLRLSLAPQTTDFTIGEATQRLAVIPGNTGIQKLRILYTLQHEATRFNTLLRVWHERPLNKKELGQIRFMELLANGGVAQKAVELKVVELLLKDTPFAVTPDAKDSKSDGGIVVVNGLDKFLTAVRAIRTILISVICVNIAFGAVSFWPGLVKLFCSRTQLVY